MTVVIAIDEFGEGFLAGNEVVRGGQANADFQRALAGNAVEVPLREYAQGLVEMGQQRIADLRRDRQVVVAFSVLTAGVESL